MSETPKTCTLARFEQLVEAYGGEPERWPSAEREAALLLLQRDPQARALQTAALRLDAQLAEVFITEPSAQLRARVLEVPIKHAREHARTPRLPASGLRLMLLALVPCVLGFVSGAWLQTYSESDDAGWSEAPIALVDDVFEEEL
jgi:hypothetical protein